MPMNSSSTNARSSGAIAGLGALLLCALAGSLCAQIPASELPPAGTDTGLEGKYDPQNGIAQLIRDKSPEAAGSKIFEDERVLVFMPLPEEEVVAPGHVLVVPKRVGARNLLDLKPDEIARPAGDRAESCDRAEEWTGCYRCQGAAEQRAEQQPDGLPCAFSCHPFVRRQSAGNACAQKEARGGRV